ncbi:uroporphyrinogen-III C-methyltransferase [Hydrogenophaga sp.]|uniref:uroporphyrinogen-III C-methyltransferase n=1 Tax=Hydrogenophaga sp. TaxID=1904254 RepID=UPI0025BEABA5|nr:uroporphyrinogen-III C-methyltransferase [Hydrogenophaga sp.]
MLAGLALVIAALALVVGGLLWQRLDATQRELARRSQESVSLADQARQISVQAEALTKELQARLTVAEVRLSEVSLQRSQLEELMLTLSRSRDDNLVQDIESALRLAQQQAQLTGSVAPLLSALQAADQRIGRSAQPRLNPVQRAIARDIDRVKGVAVADVPSVVLRLDELARQVDDWPVANQVGPSLQASVATAASATVTVSATSNAVPETAGTPTLAAEVSPAASESPTALTDPVPAAELAPATTTGWLANWRRVWDQAWTDVVRATRDLVRVSRIDQPEAALLATEQAFFLRENLKLKLLNARLGLLARQAASAQADLTAVDAALTRYFDTQAPTVAAAQAQLAKLREELLIVELPRPDESLAALATAAGGR